MIAITILFINGEKLGISLMDHTIGYESRLFDNSCVHTIEIVMDNWDELIQTATSEEYYNASVVIDGEAYKNVGIRAKGNTSLSTVKSMDSDRYSFKIEFDHYDKTKSYYGLDKLCLNNLIQDATMMKDYLTYTLMNEFDTPSPLCSFVYITVNGEDWGLYLAVEGIEESFLQRNYGSDYGNLYKPDSMSMGGGRGNGKGFDIESFMEDEKSQEFIDSKKTNAKPPEMNGNTGDGEESKPDFGAMQRPNDGGGFGAYGSDDVKLKYTGDELSSYTNIWDSAKTDITETDQTRLIESLKKLSSYEDIESVVDIDEVIRYFVVHNYVCNGDSYTGSMIHNYYLYEKDGVMSMIPWDYNLAFGTFQGGDANSTINTPIDSPISGGASSDRPMWDWILSDEKYTEQYHQYFEEFLTSVDISTIIDNAYELIKSYVEKDPTAFYSYKEFVTAVETLKEFCTLRTEAVTMQLEKGETTTEENFVDASNINLSDMGSMNTGGGFGFNDKKEGFNGPGMMRINTRPSSEQPGTGDRENPPTPPNGSERGNPFDQNNKGMPNMEINNSESNSNIWIYLVVCNI